MSRNQSEAAPSTANLFCLSLLCFRLCSCLTSIYWVVFTSISVLLYRSSWFFLTCFLCSEIEYLRQDSLFNDGEICAFLLCLIWYRKTSFILLFALCPASHNFSLSAPAEHSEWIFLLMFLKDLHRLALAMNFFFHLIHAAASVRISTTSFAWSFCERLGTHFHSFCLNLVISMSFLLGLPPSSLHSSAFGLVPHSVSIHGITEVWKEKRQNI